MKEYGLLMRIFGWLILVLGSLLILAAYGISALYGVQIAKIIIFSIIMFTIIGSFLFLQSKKEEIKACKIIGITGIIITIALFVIKNIIRNMYYKMQASMVDASLSIGNTKTIIDIIRFPNPITIGLLFILIPILITIIIRYSRKQKTKE